MLRIRPKRQTTFWKNGMNIDLQEIMAQMLISTLVRNMLQAVDMLKLIIRIYLRP